MSIAHLGKRWLYLIHRWVGIVTCLLFAIWFLSGLVMIYVPFPSLTDQERVAGLPAIDWGRVRIDAAAAERLANLGPPDAISLEMIAAQPVWRITPSSGPQATLSATTGAPLRPVGALRASEIASAFAGTPIASITPVTRDQWTVAGRFDAHRPLWKARLAGPGGRDLYVSGTNGAVLLDTDASERFWNWLGSVPHWIYPTVLRQNNEAWRQVVMWVSGPCIFGAITGLWVGLLRVRIGERRFKRGRMTPYNGWMLWHHVAGLAGGIALTLWIFSGWLSVDPFRLFASPGIDDANVAAYRAAGTLPAVALPALAAQAHDAKRISYDWAAGQPSLRIDRAAGSDLRAAATLAPLNPGRRQLLAAARRLMPGVAIASVETLTDPDAYYYEVFGRPTLPALRIIFADPAATWVHIDPASGRLLGTLDTRRRMYRWAFDLLHRWDFNVLTAHRPSRDLLLWLLSIAGIVTSISGIVLSWRRLVRKPTRQSAPRSL